MSRSQLANLASMGKPSKARAQEIIRELADSHPESVAELGALYAYFMPPAPRKPKTAFDWVAQAIGNKDVRPYVNYVHVCSNWITGTDGHRMHRIPNHDGLDPGFYNKQGEMVHEPKFANYPDIGRIVPDLMSRDRIDIAPETWPEVEIKGTPCYTLPNGMYLNKKYVDQLLNHPTGAEAIYIRETNESVRVMYHGGDDTTAVLMPVRG